MGNYFLYLAYLLIMNTSLISDLSDIVPLCPQTNLYLKPIAKVNVSVTLPKLKVCVIFLIF